MPSVRTKKQQYNKKKLYGGTHSRRIRRRRIPRAMRTRRNTENRSDSERSNATTPDVPHHYQHEST